MFSCLKKKIIAVLILQMFLGDVADLWPLATQVGEYLKPALEEMDRRHEKKTGVDLGKLRNDPKRERIEREFRKRDIEDRLKKENIDSFNKKLFSIINNPKIELIELENILAYLNAFYFDVDFKSKQESLMGKVSETLSKLFGSLEDYYQLTFVYVDNNGFEYDGETKNIIAASKNKGFPLFLRLEALKLLLLSRGIKNKEAIDIINDFLSDSAESETFKQACAEMLYVNRSKFSTRENIAKKKSKVMLKYLEESRQKHEAEKQKQKKIKEMKEMKAVILKAAFPLLRLEALGKLLQIDNKAAIDAIEVIFKSEDELQTFKETCARMILDNMKNFGTSQNVIAKKSEIISEYLEAEIDRVNKEEVLARLKELLDEDETEKEIEEKNKQAAKDRFYSLSLREQFLLVTDEDPESKELIRSLGIDGQKIARQHLFDSLKIEEQLAFVRDEKNKEMIEFMGIDISGMKAIRLNRDEEEFADILADEQTNLGGLFQNFFEVKEGVLLLREDVLADFPGLEIFAADYEIGEFSFAEQIKDIKTLLFLKNREELEKRIIALYRNIYAVIIEKKVRDKFVLDETVSVDDQLRIINNLKIKFALGGMESATGFLNIIKEIKDQEIEGEIKNLDFKRMQEEEKKKEEEMALFKEGPIFEEINKWRYEVAGEVRDGFRGIFLANRDKGMSEVYFALCQYLIAVGIDEYAFDKSDEDKQTAIEAMQKLVKMEGKDKKKMQKYTAKQWLKKVKQINKQFFNLRPELEEKNKNVVLERDLVLKGELNPDGDIFAEVSEWSEEIVDRVKEEFAISFADYVKDGGMSEVCFRLCESLIDTSVEVGYDILGRDKAKKIVRKIVGLKRGKKYTKDQLIKKIKQIRKVVFPKRTGKKIQEDDSGDDVKAKKRALHDELEIGILDEVRERQLEEDVEGIFEEYPEKIERVLFDKLNLEEQLNFILDEDNKEMLDALQLSPEEIQFIKAIRLDLSGKRFADRLLEEETFFSTMFSDCFEIIEGQLMLKEGLFEDLVESFPDLIDDFKVDSQNNIIGGVDVTRHLQFIRDALVQGDRKELEARMLGFYQNIHEIVMKAKVRQVAASKSVNVQERIVNNVKIKLGLKQMKTSDEFEELLPKILELDIKSNEIIEEKVEPGKEIVDDGYKKALQENEPGIDVPIYEVKHDDDYAFWHALLGKVAPGDSKYALDPDKLKNVIGNFGRLLDAADFYIITEGADMDIATTRIRNLIKEARKQFRRMKAGGGMYKEGAIDVTKADKIIELIRFVCNGQTNIKGIESGRMQAKDLMDFNKFAQELKVSKYENAVTYDLEAARQDVFKDIIKKEFTIRSIKDTQFRREGPAYKYEMSPGLESQIEALQIGDLRPGVVGKATLQTGTEEHVKKAMEKADKDQIKMESILDEDVADAFKGHLREVLKNIPGLIEGEIEQLINNALVMDLEGSRGHGYKAGQIYISKIDLEMFNKYKNIKDVYEGFLWYESMAFAHEVFHHMFNKLSKEEKDTKVKKMLPHLTVKFSELSLEARETVEEAIVTADVMRHQQELAKKRMQENQSNFQDHIDACFDHDEGIIANAVIGEHARNKYRGAIKRTLLPKLRDLKRTITAEDVLNAIIGVRGGEAFLKIADKGLEVIQDLAELRASGERLLAQDVTTGVVDNMVDMMVKNFQEMARVGLLIKKANFTALNKLVQEAGTTQNLTPEAFQLFVVIKAIEKYNVTAPAEKRIKFKIAAGGTYAEGREGLPIEFLNLMESIEKNELKFKDAGNYFDEFLAPADTFAKNMKEITPLRNLAGIVAQFNVNAGQGRTEIDFAAGLPNAGSVNSDVDALVGELARAIMVAA